MAIIEPYSYRSEFNESGSSLTITIPSRKHVLKIIFSIAFLTVWLFAEVMVIRQFLGGEPKEAFFYVFTTVWLLGWTAGGMMIIYGLFWSVIGEEIIEVNTVSLSVKKRIFRGRTKEYSVNHIRNLRVSTESISFHDFSAGWKFWTGSKRAIAFDYGGKTIRFGNEIDEAEAKYIIDKITERCPALKENQ